MGLSRAQERVIFVVLLLGAVLWSYSRCVPSDQCAGAPSRPAIACQITATTNHHQCPLCAAPPFAGRQHEAAAARATTATSTSPRGHQHDQEHGLDASLVMAQVVASRSRKQHDDPRPPAGRAKYLAPAFRGVRASELLTTIDNPPVPWSREAWAPLGIFTRDGRPDAPYKREATCAATAERADLATFGPVVAESQERLRPGKVAKSNPVSAACMARIEPLNPKVPLKVADACAQNQRRFPQGDAGRKEHAGLVDHGETERRANRDVKFLARECKAEFGLEPSSANTNDVARRRRPRKVFIDLGARSYYSSCKWFRDHYPGGRDFELHGFDVASKWGYSFQFDKAATFHSAAVWNDTGYVSFTLKHDTFGGRFHRNLFDAPHDLGRLVTVPAVALADALRMLVTRDDFVVVKMDVEGTEWMLLRHMAETGAFDLVDEILIECHNAEYVPGWPTRHSLADCHRMFNSLRAAGVYAHEWY